MKRTRYDELLELLSLTCKHLYSGGWNTDYAIKLAISDYLKTGKERFDVTPAELKQRVEWALSDTEQG